MKRIGAINGVKLYDLIKDRDNVALAVKNACRDHHRDPVVQQIKMNPGPYIDATLDILETESFHYSRFKHKTIFERGKKRELCYTRTFPDRIVQHAVMQIVAPILLGTCVRDTYAAREGRGIHAGMTQIREDMAADPEGTIYALKIDVHHYFPSVRRDVLFDALKRKLKCRRTLEILHRMIFECPGEDGLPIGLYSSQIFSTFYLSDFDHYCKEALGARHYYRYMDDIVLLGHSKPVLRQMLRLMERRLAVLGLSVKGNWQVFPVDVRGLDFMGFVIRHSHVLIRKRNKLAYIRACNTILHAVRHRESVTPHMLMSMSSYLGMIGWCDGRNLSHIHGGRVERALDLGADAI